MKKFPYKIEVRIENDNGASFLVAQDAAEDNDGADGEKIAFYALIEVKTLKISKSLV